MKWICPRSLINRVSAGWFSACFIVSLIKRGRMGRMLECDIVFLIARVSCLSEFFIVLFIARVRVGWFSACVIVLVR